MTFPFATSTIVAQAFGMVELSPPSSFADDSPQAADAALHYPVALDLCLEWTDWSFASCLVNLSATELPAGVAPDPDLPHIFALPADCVMLRAVLPADAPPRYRLDEGLLRADQPAPLLIRYTRRITNEARLPASFRAAMALQLAVLLAPKWLGVDAKRDRLETRLDAMQRRAGKSDAGTASPEPYGLSGSSDWVSEALR